MVRKLTLMGTIIAFSLAPMACGGKKKQKRHYGDQTEEETRLNKPPKKHEDPKDEDSEVKDDAILGTWIGECKNTFSEDDGTYSSERIVIEFSTAAVKFSGQAFNAKDCAEPKWFTKSAISSFTAGESAELGRGVKKLDMEVARLTSTPHTDNEARALNAERTCGYTGWAKNVEVDVTDLDCGEDRPINKGDKGYDIYRISGSTLQLGLNAMNASTDGNIGRTPEDRPTELGEYRYTRQD